MANSQSINAHVGLVRERIKNKKENAEFLWNKHYGRHKKVLMLCFLFALNACSNSSFRPYFYPDLPKEGSPLYQQGFKEGCNTGMTVYGNDIVRAEYHTEVTPELMQDKSYRNAWKLGNRYCRFYVSQMQMEGTIMKDFGTPVYPNRMLPNETNFNRERNVDSFWVDQEDDGGFLTTKGVEMPWYQASSSSSFDGTNIGDDGGIFGFME